MTSIKKSVPYVSIIVLAYNNLEAYTKPCVASILEATNTKNYELILVDNGSTDETPLWAQALAEQHKHIVYIQSKKNLGYAAGNNLGLQAAKGSVIILLNNDTLVVPGWLEPLITPFEHDQSLGLVGPVTNRIGSIQQIVLPRYSDKTTWVQAATSYMQQQANTFMYVQKLCFFCVAIHRRCFEAIGFLDPQYQYGNFEDDDYCQRVLQKNMKIAYTDGSFVWHHGEGTLSQESAQTRATTWHNNKQYYISKYKKYPLITEEIQNGLSCIREELMSHANSPQTIERCLAHLPYLHNALNQLKGLEQEASSIKGTFLRMAKNIDLSYLHGLLTSYFYSKKDKNI